MNFNQVWNKDKYYQFKNYLNSLKDLSYKEFNQRIVMSKKEMIGIRVPELRKIAKQIAHGDIVSYLNVCEDNYYEDILLQGLVIAQIKDDDILYSYFQKFIFKIDNWAICDMFCNSLIIVKKNKEVYYQRIKELLKAKEPFVVRVGIILLLSFYIEESYIPDIFTLVDNLNREEYYINMGVAWLLSVCYVKFKKETLNYLDNNHLNKFTYNKTIQKIIESNRVSKDEKNMLRQKKRP